MKIYQDRSWLYEMYVRKRLNLKDIVEILNNKYNIQISPQALYNWIKKYDLLKYRGKGRRLGANLQNKNKQTKKRPRNPQEERLREAARKRKSKRRR